MKTYHWLGALAAVAICSLPAAVAAAGDDKPVVVLETSMGAITLELNPAKAPVTVENFLKYVDDGYYDGLVFHRVIPEFMVQGGGMTSNMREKGGTRAGIKNESGNGLSNLRGTISMARTGDPDSATAQFFINVGDNGPRGLDAKGNRAGYAVFGKVIAGMDVVDKIVNAPTDKSEAPGGVPREPILIKSARRKKA